VAQSVGPEFKPSTTINKQINKYLSNHLLKCQCLNKARKKKLKCS
jgi:hypothetical protein